MTSANSNYQLAVKYAYNRLNEFISTPLKENLYLESFFQLKRLQELGALEWDLYETLVKYSADDRLAHLSLQRICAHFEVKQIEKPRSLATWLVNYLQGHSPLPSSHKTGPKTTEVRDLLLLVLALDLKHMFDFPIYPRPDDGLQECALAAIAEASFLLWKESETVGRQKVKRLLPTTVLGLENLYKKGIKKYPFLKFNFSEFHPEEK